MDFLRNKKSWIWIGISIILIVVFLGSFLKLRELVLYSPKAYTPGIPICHGYYKILSVRYEGDTHLLDPNASSKTMDINAFEQYSINRLIGIYGGSKFAATYYDFFSKDVKDLKDNKYNLDYQGEVNAETDKNIIVLEYNDKDLHFFSRRFNQFKLENSDYYIDIYVNCVERLSQEYIMLKLKNKANIDASITLVLKYIKDSYKPYSTGYSKDYYSFDFGVLQEFVEDPIIFKKVVGRVSGPYITIIDGIVQTYDYPSKIFVADLFYDTKSPNINDMSSYIEVIGVGHLTKGGVAGSPISFEVDGDIKVYTNRSGIFRGYQYYIEWISSKPAFGIFDNGDKATLNRIYFDIAQEDITKIHYFDDDYLINNYLSY